MSLPEMVMHEFVTVYDFLADGKPHMLGLDGRSSVIKVPVKDIREELKNRGFLDVDDEGKITATSRSHFNRSRCTLCNVKNFAERSGLIWRKGVSNLSTKTDG